MGCTFLALVVLAVAVVHILCYTRKGKNHCIMRIVLAAVDHAAVDLAAVVLAAVELGAVDAGAEESSV